MTFAPEDRTIQAQRAIDRAKAITIPCDYCHAPVGQECVSTTGNVLFHQAAHGIRLRESGVV